MYNDFLLVTSLAESFVNSDWLELVIYFQTKKPNGKQNFFMVNFSDNSDLRQGFKASLSDFWDRVISLRTAESHRYVFGRYRCLHFVTNWLWKIFNISRNASYRSPLFSRISIVPPVKALAEDQVHYLNVLGLRGSSTFNLRSFCERCCEFIKTVSGCRTFSH